MAQRGPPRVLPHVGCCGGTRGIPSQSRFVHVAWQDMRSVPWRASLMVGAGMRGLLAGVWRVSGRAWRCAAGMAIVMSTSWARHGRLAGDRMEARTARVVCCASWTRVAATRGRRQRRVWWCAHPCRCCDPLFWTSWRGLQAAGLTSFGQEASGCATSRTGEHDLTSQCCMAADVPNCQPSAVPACRHSVRPTARTLASRRSAYWRWLARVLVYWLGGLPFYGPRQLPCSPRSHRHWCTAQTSFAATSAC